MQLSLITSLLIALVSAVPVPESIIAPIAPDVVLRGLDEAQLVAGDVEGIVEEVPAFLTENLTKSPLHRGRQQCVRRFASSSTSSDSCDCCEECRKVYYDWMDFYTSSPDFTPITGTWSYYNVTDSTGAVLYTADNGNLVTGCSGGVLDTKVFTTFQATTGETNLEDHAKYWAYANTPIPVPAHGDAVVKWAANVQTFKTEENPFPSAIVERNDFRLANAQFMAFDPETGLNFGFIVTNHRVFLLYQRIVNVEQPPRAVFTFLVPVKIRRVCDWHDLEIVLHGDSKEVSYHVDNQEVFVINQVGYLLDRDYMVEDFGGAEEKIWPTEIFYGFGSFTGLDYYPSCQRTESCRSCRYPFVRQALVQLIAQAPDSGFSPFNPIFGPQVPMVYYNIAPDVGRNIWGQGVVTKIRKLIAYQRLPVC